MEADTAAVQPRRSELTRLKKLIEGTKTNGISLCYISGPGGIGKTRLLFEAAAPDWCRENGYLRLMADASNTQVREDLVALVDGQMAPLALPAPARPDHDYFPSTRKLIGVQRGVVQAAEKELENSQEPAEVKNLIRGLLRTGRAFNKMLPVGGDTLNVVFGTLDHNIDSVVEGVWSTARALDALSTGRMTRRLTSRVKDDLYNALAAAYLADLEEALATTSTFAQAIRLKHPLEGSYRFLLIIDDFEFLSPILSQFLTGSLIPALSKARFPSLLLIVGRDSPDVTHPSWQQHCSSFVKESIKLASFSKEETFGLLKVSKIRPDRWDEIYLLSMGMPFLLTHFIEEAEDGGESALSLKTFFDRTTRWMSEQEHGWFRVACYLSKINVDILSAFFPAEEARRIQRWFESEASIREPRTVEFTVRPLIRDKVLRYFEIRSPSEYRAMTAKAAAAVAAPFISETVQEATRPSS